LLIWAWGKKTSVVINYASLHSFSGWAELTLLQVFKLTRSLRWNICECERDLNLNNILLKLALPYLTKKIYIYTNFLSYVSCHGFVDTQNVRRRALYFFARIQIFPKLGIFRRDISSNKQQYAIARSGSWYRLYEVTCNIGDKYLTRKHNYSFLVVLNTSSRCVVA